MSKSDLAALAITLRASLKTGFKALALTAFIVVSLPSQVVAEDAGNSAPAMWKASRGDATAYIFGTIHILKPGVPWFTPAVRTRFDAADTLVVEVTGLSQNDPALGQLVMGLGMYPAGDSLGAHVSEEIYAAVVTEAAKIGLPEQAVKQMRPWMASITLTAVGAMARGYLPDYGVDVTLEKMAADAGKASVGLETAEFQLGLFANMPEQLQIDLLETTLKEISELDALFARMDKSWISGDVEGLAAIMNEGFEDNEEAMELLISSRNRNWVEQIDVMLSHPGVSFIAVGAGHLAGKDSLIGMLKDAGIDIKRE